VGRACNTKRSPESIIGSARILGVHVLKDVCFTPGGFSCAPESRVRLKLAEGRATCSDRMRGVSRGHNVTGGNEMRENLRVKRNKSLTPVKGPNGARIE
jgi:hypothetical protein